MAESPPLRGRDEDPALPATCGSLTRTAAHVNNASENNTEGEESKRGIDRVGDRLLPIGEGEAAGLRERAELLETHLVDEGVQHRDAAAQISDTLIEGLDLLLQLRNALAIGDRGSLLLTTILASANSTDFCTSSADTGQKAHRLAAFGPR